jgi:predicted transposase YbfD/YdcC
MILRQDYPTLSGTISMTPDRDAVPLPMDPASILEHFALLPDPRREHGQVHRLDEVVFMAICGVLCGADSWQEIADYSESKLDWLSTFLSLPGGIPSHDTFRRVFCLLDPMAFQGCFSDWMTSLMARYGLTPVSPGRPELRPVAIDGKTQRGSARRTVGRSPLHVVSAWAVENHLSLGQVATDAKSNEITAIPELLKLLDLEGAVVTIDAMGCQKDIATGIVREKGEYALAVKENQPHLYEDIGRAFDEALADGEPGVDFTIAQTEEVRSGRQETRTCCVITNPVGIRDMGLWTKLTAICMVASERVIQGVPSHEVRYFIGSVAGTAEEYLRWVRGHWGIENSLHWVLDVCFREDDQRHWAGHSAANLAWIRKLALSLLKAEPTSKAKSINRRRHLAGWRDDYLLQVLAQIPQKSDA